MHSQHINTSTHTNMSMSSMNISIKQEAYDYLKSIKSEEESFSDAILQLKKEQNNTQHMLAIVKKYKKPSAEHIKQRKETIRKQREEIDTRIQR